MSQVNGGRVGLRGLLRRTPFHPQWLIGRRRVPHEVSACNGIVVDVGSADQWLRARLDPGAKYVALDLPAAGGGAYAAAPEVFATAEALPLLDEVADVVVCLEVLEHVKDPERAVREAARVLRSGGCYVTSMPFMYPLHDRPFDFRRATPYGLTLLMEQAGLEVYSIRRILRSVETAGLLAALSIAGGVQRGGWRWLLLPLAAPLVLVINLGAWSIGRMWPDWDGMAMGYEALARKP